MLSPQPLLVVTRDPGAVGIAWPLLVTAQPSSVTVRLCVRLPIIFWPVACPLAEASSGTAWRGLNIRVT